MASLGGVGLVSWAVDAFKRILEGGKWGGFWYAGAVFSLSVGLLLDVDFVVGFLEGLVLNIST